MSSVFLEITVTSYLKCYPHRVPPLLSILYSVLFFLLGLSHVIGLGLKCVHERYVMERESVKYSFANATLASYKYYSAQGPVQF